MALIWLLPRVGAHVRSQGGRPGVHFITQATLVRLALTGWSYDRELDLLLKDLPQIEILGTLGVALATYRTCQERCGISWRGKFIHW